MSRMIAFFAGMSTGEIALLTALWLLRRSAKADRAAMEQLKRAQAATPDRTGR